MMKKIVVAIMLNIASLAGYWYAFHTSNKFLKSMITAKKSIHAYKEELFHGDSKSDTGEDMEISIREVSESEVPEEFLKAALQQHLDNDSEEIRSLNLDAFNAKDF